MFDIQNETEDSSPLQLLFRTYWILEKLRNELSKYESNNKEAVEDAVTGEC